MADDFNVRFGSNARKFSQDLINDLKPARKELIGFIQLLGDVDKASRTALGRAGQAVPSAQRATPQAQPGATSALAVPKIDMSGVENEIKSMTADLDGMIGKLNTVILGLGRAVPGIENFVKKQNYSQGSRSKWENGTDPGRGQGGRFSSDPNAVRDSAKWGLNGKQIADAIAARDAKLSQPARVDFSGLTKLQLDQGGFDRVVNKLEEIKSAIAARGGAGRVAARAVDDEAAAVTKGKGKKGGKSAGQVVEDAAKVTADEMTKLRADLEKAQQLIVKRFGSDAPAELTASINQMRSRLAAEEAKADRETRGVTQGQQKSERRGAAAADRKKFDDLDRAEYDARKARLKLIQDAGRADFQEQANVRGKGGTSRQKLIDTAQAFQDVGFDVPYGSKTNKSQLASRIVSARQAFEAEHGTDIPDSLRVGTPPKGPDTVSEALKKLIGNMNHQEIEEERRAREIRRLAYQVGNVPKDPTGRALTQTPGSINVPPGMVKGGGFYDAFGLNDATRLIDQRGLGRAAVRANDPSFNPFAVSEKEHIQGGGDVAKEARTQLRELKRATRELDALGKQYDTLADSLRDNRRGLATLEGRVGTDKEKAGDGDRMRGMEQSIALAQKQLQSTRFAGLQDLFEDPQYQAGRRTRDDFRADQEDARQARLDAQPAHERAYVNDAAAQAVAGSRTEGRGYRRPIPGLRPDGENLAFTDDQRNPADLKKLNSAFRKYKAGLRRETQLAEDLANGVEGITKGHVQAEIGKTDNQITKFLNEIGHLFGKGTAPGFESLIGRAPQTKKAIDDEARRNQEKVALDAVAKAKPVKPTDVQVAAQRAKSVERTKKLLSQAEADLTAAEKAEEKAVKKATATTDARSKAEREAISARTRAEAHEVGLLLNPPADRFKDASKLVGKDPRDLNAHQRQQQQDYREYAAGYAERLTAARHDVSTHPEIELSPDEQKARDASKARAVAEQRKKSLESTLAAREARSADAQANIGGKDPEVTTLQKRLSRSQNLRKELSTLRAAVKTAATAEDEDARAAAAAERDAFKKKNQRYILSRAEQRQLRQRIAGLNAGDAAGGGGEGGGKVPTASGAAGGGGGSTNSLLRQILASVNAIKTQVQTGVKISGGKATVNAQGEVVAATRRTKAVPGVAEIQSAALTGDPREVAKAAAQEQARIEAQRKAGTLNAVQAQKQSARINSEAEKATRKLSEAQLSQARAEESLRQSKARLNTAATEELAKLKELIRTGGTANEVVKQQARAYAATNQSLANSGVAPGTERHKQIRDLIGDAQGSKVSGPSVDEIRRSASSINGFKVVDQAMSQTVPGGGIFGEQSAFTKAMFGNHGFWSRVMASTGTFVVRNFTAGFVFGLTNALQDVVRQAIITESTFIRVSDALEQTGRSSGNLRTQLQGISSQYGTNLEDVYETAAGLTGLFDKIDDIAGATRVVSQLQSISMGALNATEAMGALASITGAYGDELKGGTDGLSQVADVLTVIQNVIGTNVETTAEGVGALSGLSKQLKIDFEDTAVYVAQIAKLTNQTGAAAGDQFSRILAAMQTGRGRAALTKDLKGTGIEAQLGEGNYGGALQTLLKNWDKLSDGQQRNIAVTVAGQRQARAFYALMNNSDKVLDASARAHDAQGQAAQRAAAIANTLNGLIAKLTSNLTNLAQNLVRTGILDFFGLLLHVVNGVLSGINHVFSVVNDFADGNPILNFMKHLTAGLLGFVITAKLAQLAFRGFRASLGELRAGEGVMAAGVQGALGKNGAPAGQSLRSSLFNAPTAGAAALERRAERLRSTANPSIYGTAYDRNGAPIPGRESGSQRFTSGQRVLQGPQMQGGGFFVNPAAGAAEKEAGRVSRAFAGTASGASRALRGVGTSLNGVRDAGLAAQLGIAGIIALFTVGIQGLAEHGQRADEYRKLYKEDTGRTSVTEKGPNQLNQLFGTIGNVFGGGSQKDAEKYVGPYTEQMKANFKQASGFWGGLKTGLGEGFANFNPKNWHSDDFGGANNAIDKAKGKLSDDAQNQLDALAKRLAQEPPKLKNYDGQGRLIGDMSKVDRLQAAGKIGRKDIDDAKKKIDEDTSLTEEQRTTAMAGIEKLQKAYADNMNAKILTAKGVASQDILSTDQLSKLDATTQLMSTIGTSSGGVDASNPKYADLIKKRLEDTGIRSGSTIGTALSTLSKGGLNKGDALTQAKIINDEAIKQLQARIAAAQSSGAEDEVEALQQTLDSFVANQAQILQQIIDAVAATAQTIGDYASSQGRFGAAAGASRSARNRIARMRVGVNESPEVRAARNSTEAKLSESAAGALTQGQTLRLTNEKSRGVGALRSAQIDAETARVTRDNLIKERKNAQASGAIGPTLSAIQQAKRDYWAAERSNAIALQDAGIASLTAQAATLWNGIASAQMAETIALQQLTNAKKNFGAGSAEALQAAAAYSAAQHATIQAQDQVAESTRQAMIASIPSGNAVGVARAQLSAARAGVAAAQKYGHNSTEYQGALAQLYSAQQQAQSAQSAVRVAQAQLAQSYAEARGDTVGAARAGERVARAQLAAAKKASGGANSADVLAAKGAAVQARAATRDAILTDRLDTIDFNLQMGKITQSSAIAAMRQILRTANLTKQQRRDLLLKIKGMKDEIADTQWNFGSADLPTPYQMRRYVRAEAMNAAQSKMTPYRDATSLNLQDRPSRGGEPGAINDNRTVLINGADTAKVRKILEEILGKGVKTRTAQGRRR